MRCQFIHLSPSRTEGQETVEVYLNSAIRVQGVALLDAPVSYICRPVLLIVEIHYGFALLVFFKAGQPLVGQGRLTV
jgi:hypothetical protein